MADASSWSRFYVPEIHDVHPGMETALDALLDAFPRSARDKTMLLVVPDWRGAEPLAHDTPFCARLRAHQGEIVQHGCTHSLGPNFLDWLLYGHDNRSEFARLAEGEAARRLAEGRALLTNALGRSPSWFCAPRWQQSAATLAPLKAQGFSGYQLQKTLMLVSGGAIPLPALCFDEGERALKIAAEYRLREGRIAKLLSTSAPFRLTLHPSDPLHPKSWAQAKTLLARLEQDGWQPLSLDEAQQRWSARAAAAA